MVGSSKGPSATPPAPPSLKKSSSSSKNQTSIAGFFRKREAEISSSSVSKSSGTALPVRSPKKNGLRKSPGSSSQSLTPAPNSDAAEEIKEEEVAQATDLKDKLDANGLPSPITPASAVDTKDQEKENIVPKGFYSPSRKVSFPTVVA